MQPIEINIKVKIGLDSGLSTLITSVIDRLAPRELPAEPERQEPEGPEGPTAADVRAAMDRTRRRIEGADYMDRPDSEGYRKWHRALTAWFKGVSASCGADRPSELPDSRSRRSFIESCDAVYVGEDGELKEKIPF